MNKLVKNYEKLYKDALERARAINSGEDVDTSSGTTICEYIFPELAESEDEKTKRILHSISSKISFHLHDIFTEEEFQCFDTWSNDWLEKQAEKKSSDEVNPKMEKLKKLADAMYEAAQHMTTDASRLRKAMKEYHQFVFREYYD